MSRTVESTGLYSDIVADALTIEDWASPEEAYSSLSLRTVQRRCSKWIEVDRSYHPRWRRGWLRGDSTPFTYSLSITPVRQTR
jgi:hypothetical protein